MTALLLDVPDDLIARLEAAAARSSVTRDELARSILTGALPAPLEIRNGKRVLPEIPTWDSGDPLLAEKVDEILAAEWVDAIERNH